MFRYLKIEQVYICGLEGKMQFYKSFAWLAYVILDIFTDLLLFMLLYGLPWWLNAKESACNARQETWFNLFNQLGRYPGEWNGNPLQYSCLEMPMDRGTWWATVHGVAKSWTWLSVYMHIHNTHTKKHTQTHTDTSLYYLQIYVILIDFNINIK